MDDQEALREFKEWREFYGFDPDYAPEPEILELIYQMIVRYKNES